MAEQNLNARVSVSADASPVEALIKVLQKMEKVSAQLANVLPAATEALAEFGGAAVATTEAADKAAKSAKNLDKSIGDSSQTQKSSKFLKNYVATVNELRAALGRSAVPVNFFPDTSSAVTEIKKLEGEVLGLVNVYRSAFGQENLLEKQFDPKQAIAELENFQQVIQNLATAARTGTSIDFNFEAGNQSLRDFEDTLNKINSIGIRPSNAELALSNFEELRGEGNRLSAEVQRIQEEMVKVGPAATLGSEDAIREMGRLSKSLRETQDRASELGRELVGAIEEFGRQTGPANRSLKSLGFEEIKLEDIFPTEEQRKVQQLQQKIDSAVRNTVQEGAVKRTLNLFLAQDRQIESVDRNVLSLTSHLPRLRYALYDVSNTATIFGTALVGAITASVSFAADYERAFADVVRTTGVARGEAQELRRDLIELSKEIPVSFTELAEIATLAGQLNIANAVIDDFTDTVAKFAATTDVTIEAAATAFGRLDQLVDGVNGQFEKLGSAILAVGVDAVATESDIIAISTQIASVANIAGFSAAELVGFSSALASVGTRPELARGTFTRLFTEIQQSVAGGGDQLAAFARVAGQSQDEFIEAWGAGSGAEQVIAILRGVGASGSEADQVLAQLGITSVRDVPTLLKLAQSVGEVERQINVAKLGFQEGTELQEQYGVITATLSEQIEVLKNNFGALVASLGSLSSPLSGVVFLLGKFLGVIESVANTRLGGFVLGTLGLFASLVGVASLAVGAFARFGASAAGAGTALIELFETMAFTKIQVEALSGATAGSTAAKLKDIAVTKTKIAQERRRAVAEIKTTAGVKSSTIATVAKTRSLRVLQAQASSAGATLVAYTARVRAAGAAALNAARQTKAYSTAITGLRAARSIGILLAVSFAIEKGAEAMGLLGEKTENVQDKFEDWGTILEAVKQDSRDFANATEENIDQFTVIGETVNKTADDISNYSRVLAVTSGEEKALASLLDQSSEAYERQTIAIGENTRAVLAQRLAKELAAAADEPTLKELATADFGDLLNPETNSAALRRQTEALDALISTFGTNLSASLRESGFSYAQWSDAILTGNVELADSIANRLSPAAARLAEQFAEEDPIKYAKEIEILNTIANGGSNALINFASSNDEVVRAVREAQIEIEATGGVYEEAEEDVQDFRDTLNDFVDTAYASVNAERAMEDAITRLGSVFFEEGSGVAASSKEMQEAITGIMNAAENEEDAVEGLTGFYNAIIDGGYASAEELEILQGVIIETYRTAADAQIKLLKDQRAALDISKKIAISRSSGRGNYARAAAANEELQAINRQIDALEQAKNNIDAIGESTADSADSANLLAKGYDEARKSAAGAKDEVEEIEEETEKAVRTLLDYASDLENVFSRAFDLRCGRGISIDEITDAWESFTNQVEDATQSLEELLATQQDLAADRAIKEYFLSVAESYDDQLRAAKLRAEIAQLDNESAEAARELAEAQERSAGATALTGEGAGARQNRQALLGLVRNYQDYITVLAESGAGQDELRAATEDARKEYNKQATELGFAEEEVMMYAEAFDDVRTAINRVPRDITIDFNADPALQALNELNAKLDESIEKAKELNRQQRVDPPPQRERTESFEPVIQNTTRAAIIDSVKQSRVLTPIQKIQYEREIRAQVPFFADGGFTGRGGRMDPAGIVHKGEYVVPKQYVNQSTGLPDASFLAQLQNGMRGYQMGGFVGGGMSDSAMMVELSPYDRKLLENAGNVQLRLNGKVVAEATNQNNFNQARRGSD